MNRGYGRRRFGAFANLGGGFGPLLRGLLAAGLVALTLMVAVALGMQEQELIAAVAPTATRILPSATMEATSVPLPSPTSEPPTVLPTETLTEQATDTATPSPVPTLSATPQETSRPRIYPTAASRRVYPTPVVACSPRKTWHPYTIQSGDTLWSIAAKTGSTVPDLMTANCLRNYTIRAGGTLYVPSPPPATPAPIAAPRIARFTIDRSGEITVGQCVRVQWSVTGRVTRLTLTVNSSGLWSGTTMVGSWTHCPTRAGTIAFRLTASGPGGTTSAGSKPLKVVSVPGTVAPTETNTPLPGPTDATSTPEEPTVAPATGTAVSPMPTTAMPTDTPISPSSTPVPPTATPIPPSATPVPPPSATPVPPPTATLVPPPTATPVPPPTATPVPPPTDTPVPPPETSPGARLAPGLPGFSRAA